ncbi:MAG TPA: histidine phosphatase family protein [Thermoanaerobaculia bacterium]|nr:histidine phosphatase family protein [Thermoanaerobaculia bacterium]
MRVLLVRHAIATDRDRFRGPDGERPLTAEGIRRFRRGARALADLVPELELVCSSPLVRARQTAELLVAAHPARPLLAEAIELAPGGSAAAAFELVRAQKGVATSALVGHEPGLSRLEGYLLTGREGSLAELRKGGVALLDFPGRLAPGRAVLVWHLTAGQLRRLAP